jgi:hypothetical protein
MRLRELAPVALPLLSQRAREHHRTRARTCTWAHTHTARHESTPSPNRHPHHTTPHHTTPHRTAPHRTTPHQARSQGALRHTPFSSPVALSLSARSSAAPGFPCLPVDRSGRTTTQVHIPRTGGTSVEVSCYGMPPPPARLPATLIPLREYAHATAPAILTPYRLPWRHCRPCSCTQHFTAIELRERLGVECFDQLVKFSIVRCPFTRLARCHQPT